MTSQILCKMAAPTKIEFAVQMTCDGCATSVRKALGGVEGVNGVTVDVDKQQVIVDTVLSSAVVKDLIETTGKRAVLKGLGSALVKDHLGAGVAKLSGDGTEAAKTIGVARMVQVDEDTCVIDGTVDGLPQGPLSVRIHEYGDISNGCDSCGGILGSDEVSDNKKTKLRNIMRNFAASVGFTLKKPIGELTTVEVGPNGRLEFRLTNPNLKVWDVIGRSMVLHSGNRRLACGIIARSAGIFENTKTLCACDGVPIWDERNVPAAGGARLQYSQQAQPQANL